MPGSGPTGHTEVPRERPGTGSAGRPEGLRDPGIPDRRRVQVPRRGRGGSAGRPGPRDGRKERKGVRQVRPRTGGPHPPASQSPSGKGVRAAGPRRRPRAKAASAHRLPPSFPVPARGPGPRRGGRGASAAAATPWRADTPAVRPPPSSPFPSTRPSPRTPQEGGTGTNPRRPAVGGRRARPARRPPPSPNPGRGAGWGTRPRGQRGPGSGPAERKEGEGTPGSRRGRGGGTPDKPLCRGLTFNRSQRGSCSATYETPTQKQVVYEWFSTRFPTNVRCVTGEGAAPFPAAPCFPGRGASAISKDILLVIISEKGC